MVAVKERSDGVRRLRVDFRGPMWSRWIVIWLSGAGVKMSDGIFSRNLSTIVSILNEKMSVLYLMVMSFPFMLTICKFMAMLLLMLLTASFANFANHSSIPVCSGLPLDSSARETLMAFSSMKVILTSL